MRSLLLVLVFLSGCSTTVPVTQKFPQAPDVLFQQCELLKEVAQEASLIDLTKVVVENYTKHYQCSILVEGWQNWYKAQQQIYKELK